MWGVRPSISQLTFVIESNLPLWSFFNAKKEREYKQNDCFVTDFNFRYRIVHTWVVFISTTTYYNSNVYLPINERRESFDQWKHNFFLSFEVETKLDCDFDFIVVNGREFRQFLNPDLKSLVEPILSTQKKECFIQSTDKILFKKIE